MNVIIPKDISSPGQFGMCMFCPYRHMDISSPWTFRQKDFSARGYFGTRNFQHHGRFSTGYFSTCTFRHMDILAPCKAIWMFRHRHFGTCANVRKCPCVEMSPCRNVHCTEKYLCQKVPVLKSPCTETSMEMKCPCAGMPTGLKRADMSGWNVRFRNGGKPKRNPFWNYEN